MHLYDSIRQSVRMPMNADEIRASTALPSGSEQGLGRPFLGDLNRDDMAPGVMSQTSMDGFRVMSQTSFPHTAASWRMICRKTDSPVALP